MGRTSVGDRDVRAIALLALAVLGLGLRVALSAVSFGSYDAMLWSGFAAKIAEHGLLDVYATERHFNHPPIPGYWAALAWLIAERLPGASFPFVFRLPMIAADAVVCVLLWKIWSRRSCGAVFAALVAAGFAWNLDAILVSAHHCNTDPLYAALALLAVYLVEDRRAHFLGGLALGAAINVKLIPVLLVFPMVGGYRDARQVARFLAGLAVAALPFVPVLLLRGAEFSRNAIDYTSVAAYWGVNLFLLEMVRLPRFLGWAQPILEYYQDLGRYVLVLAVSLAVLVARRRGELDRYSTCAVTAALFLILAPGFAIQYTVFAGALLFAVRPGVGALYGALVGIQLFITYWLGGDGRLPIDSGRTGDHAAPGPLFGLLAWAVLIAFVWHAYFRRETAPHADRGEAP